MSREEDKKISNWACLLKLTGNPNGEWIETPHFTTSDSDAITLLPVLVERGYAVNLSGSEMVVECAIAWLHGDKVYEVSAFDRPTISAAITSAILQLIDSEK